MIQKISGNALLIWLNTLILIGFALSDVHTAFDVSTDVENGGCRVDLFQNINEVVKVEMAFTETMQMIGLIQNAIVSIQAGTEAPAVGWIFSALFAIQATEDLLDRGIARPQAQTDALATMNNLMTLIVKHSQGNLPLVNAAGVVRHSRIFCNKDWVVATNVRINPATGLQFIPTWPMPNGQPPGQLFYYDIQADIYLHPPTHLLKPLELVCGANNGGFTSTDSNVITFCPVQFAHDTTIASKQKPFPAALPPDLLGTFHAMSMTFLHEYTHLVGRSAFGNQANPIPQVSLFPEAYSFPDAHSLATQSGVQVAITNADSYALLGVALLLSDCDWRDGTCRSPAFWASERQAQRGFAQVLAAVGQSGGLLQE